MRFLGLDLVKLISESQADGFDRSDSVARFDDLVAEVRECLGLEEWEPLVFASAGSHSKYYEFLAAGSNNAFYGNRAKLLVDRFGHAKRRRLLACQLNTAFESLFEHAQSPVELEWVSSVYPALLPQEPLPVEMTGIVESAKELVLRRQDGLGEPKKGAVPLVYVREQGDRWRPLDGQGAGDDPATTTDALIDQFASRRAEDPKIEGVLVKVLGHDLDRHAKIDPPIIGSHTLENAAAAGISAIVLDGRCGAVIPGTRLGISEKAAAVPIYSSLGR